jgi:hypothetical protein
MLDCVTGIAVKDGSEATIENNTVGRVQVGLALYVKQPVFGPGKLELRDFYLYDVKAPFVVADGFETTVDGVKYFREKSKVAPRTSFQMQDVEIVSIQNTETLLGKFRDWNIHGVKQD